MAPAWMSRSPGVLSKQMNLLRLRSKSSRFLGGLRPSSSPARIILMYHRVAEPECDPWSLCVSPNHFNEHLAILRQSTCTTTLRQLVSSFERPKLKRHPIVVLTFDDGYADNLLAARPLLERYDVPATVFLTAGALESEREFWWDELERIFLQTESLPKRLEIKIGGVPHRWELGDSAIYGTDQRHAHRSWKAGSDPPTVRQELYYSIWSLLRPLRHLEQQGVLNQLLLWANLDSIGRSSYRSLTRSEVIQLGSSDLIEIGAHTMTHPELSSHSVPVQENEIRQSKIELEKLVGRNVSQFAYPFGDYSGATVTSVKAAGFDLACSTNERRIARKIEPYALPRFHVQNWPAEEFERRLGRMFRS